MSGSESRGVRMHFFLIIPIILVSSYLVWSVNVGQLQHNRNFYRALNYHILKHQTIDLYWFGQGMNNYPINEYTLLPDFQQFTQRMHTTMANLQLLAYAPVDQRALNLTRQTV